MIRFAENLNKMISAGLGGALEAPSTEVSVGHRIRHLEASGAVASFETNIAAPIRSLRVDMQPIQDLHGQDAPYPAGGGKNKWNGKFIGVGFIESDTYSSTYSFIGNAAMPIEVGKQYIASVDGVRISIRYAFLDADKKMLGNYTNGDYTTAAPNDAVYLQWRAQSNLGAVTKGQIEVGTSATPYAPYSNICPISGRESVMVWREASYNPSADPALTIQLGDTVYGGTLDVTTGVMTVEWENIASYDGEALPGEWISDRDACAPGTTPTTGAQVVYVLDTPQTIDLDPQQITTLIGDNNVWTDAGDVTLEYPYYEETEGY